MNLSLDGCKFLIKSNFKIRHFLFMNKQSFYPLRLRCGLFHLNALFKQFREVYQLNVTTHLTTQLSTEIEKVPIEIDDFPDIIVKLHLFP